jgi:hypothetical protein
MLETEVSTSPGIFLLSFDVTLKGTEQRAHQCLDFLRSAVTFFQGSFQQRYSHDKAGISLGKTLDGHSLTPFHQHFDGAIGQSQQLQTFDSVPMA